MPICNEIALSFVTAMAPWMEFYITLETFAFQLRVSFSKVGLVAGVCTMSFSNAKRDTFSYACFFY